MRRMHLMLASLALFFVSERLLSAGELPPDVVAGIKALGSVIDAPGSAKLLAPLQVKAPVDGITITRDERYGRADRNRLDVFAPAREGAPRPVLIFVHGGGFIRGDKRQPNDSPFYDNVGLWAASQRLLGITMTYRLAPDHLWPAGVEDVAAAVAWTKSNAARFGGDPARIYLMGHSAGATLVAAYVAHPEFQVGQGSGLAGAILASSIYRIAPDTVNEDHKRYFGEDQRTWSTRSSLAGLAVSALPLLVLRAEFDPPTFAAQFEELKNARCAKQECPRSAILAGQGHMSEIYALNTGDQSLSEPVLAFVQNDR